MGAFALISATYRGIPARSFPCFETGIVGIIHHRGFHAAGVKHHGLSTQAEAKKQRRLPPPYTRVDNGDQSNQQQRHAYSRRPHGAQQRRPYRSYQR